MLHVIAHTNFADRENDNFIIYFIIYLFIYCILAEFHFLNLFDGSKRKRPYLIEKVKLASSISYSSFPQPISGLKNWT